MKLREKVVFLIGLAVVFALAVIDLSGGRFPMLSIIALGTLAAGSLAQRRRASRRPANSFEEAAATSEEKEGRGRHPS